MTEYEEAKLRDQLGNPVDITITIKKFQEDLIPEENSLRMHTNTIGNSMILDHPVNGVMDATHLAVNGLQIQMDATNRGGETLVQVTNPNNIYIDHFTTTTFRNTATTSADWAVSAEELSFTNGEVATSNEVFYADGTLSSAKISVTTTSGDVADLAFELTADGGSNWESVTHNTDHVFANRSNDMRFRITAAGTVVISTVRIEYTKA